MSETTQLTVYKQINSPQLGELIKLPNLYADSLRSVEAAEAAKDKFLKVFQGVDYTKADLAKMQPYLDAIDTYLTKLEGTHKNISNGRTPHTQFFDFIRGSFTALEGRVNELVRQCKDVKNKKEAEVIRRNNVASQTAATNLANAQARITRINALVVAFNTAYGKLVIEDIGKMKSKYMGILVEADLRQYVESLKKWKPKVELQIGNVTKDVPGAADELMEAIGKVKVNLETQYKAAIGKAIDALDDELAGRILQLNQPAATPAVDVFPDVLETLQPVHSWISEVESEVKGTVEQMNTAADTEASAASMNAAFDNAPVVTHSVSKGTREKKKYKVDSHEGMQQIIQAWVTFSFPKLSVDEINTKLSFMRTACDEMLNNGTLTLEGKGLSIVNDVRAGRGGKQKDK